MWWQRHPHTYIHIGGLVQTGGEVGTVGLYEAFPGDEEVCK